jgi:Overcoming lysogenization defect protein-like, TOPRIM domain
MALVQVKRDVDGQTHTVVLVEGVSDKLALEALAARRDRDLDADGLAIVPMGGAQAIGRFLERFGPQGLDLRLAGLCDEAEEGDFRRALERAGLGSSLTRAGMERLGFYVCVADLENELVRSAGAAAVEQVIAAEGELGSFRTFQKQPAKRELPYEEQLWRFMWNRKERYATLLVQALDLTRVPRPLDGVLARVYSDPVGSKASALTTGRDAGAG